MKRFFRTRATGLLLALVVLSGAMQGQRLRATRVETVGFTVSDMDRSIDFYTDVLHFQKVGDRVLRVKREWCGCGWARSSSS